MHPVLLHLGHFTLPTFGLLAAAGLIGALVLSQRSAAAVGISPDVLWDAGLFAVMAAFVLSRLLLVLSDPGSFRAHPLLVLTLPSLTPLGLGLTAAALLLYLRRHRISLGRALDAWAPCGALLWAGLALGHFAEGSDPGLPARHLGLRIPPDPLPLHPVALYAAMAAVALTLLLLRALRRVTLPGGTAALALGLAGLLQYLLTFLRQPYPYLTPSAWQLDPIQIVSLGMMAAGAALYLFARVRERRRVAAPQEETVVAL